MATVSAWAKPGAWALDSEENEAIEAMKQQQHKEKSQFAFEEEKQQQQQPLSDFPSLAAAATAKPSKKKKSQPVSLAEFTNGKQVTYGASKAQPKGLTHDELLTLPTGPRERTAEELDRSRLGGGGFNSYGGGGSRRVSNGEDSSNSRWGSSRVSDEPRRNGGFNRDSAPSRADEIDDWGAGKKSAPTAGYERRERSGGFFDNQSRADDSESWVSNKSFVPSEGRRFDGFRERKGGFDMLQKEVSNGGGDSDSWGKKKEEGSGRPRLVLQPRTLPVSNGDQQPHQQQQQPGLTKSKVLSPFGEARPREEVLAEKGQDWKKIDEQLESMKIKEVGPAAGTVSDDGPSFGKKSFGSGNGRSLPEDRTERNWRKAEPADGLPSSDETDDGVANN